MKLFLEEDSLVLPERTRRGHVLLNKETNNVKKQIVYELSVAKCGKEGKSKLEVSNPGTFSYTPEPHVAFCPIFVHPLFPVFEHHIQKWVIFVRRRRCVYDTFRFESPPLRGKKIEFGTDSSPPPSRGLRQLNFPNVKNDAGQK